MPPAQRPLPSRTRTTVGMDSRGGMSVGWFWALSMGVRLVVEWTASHGVEIMPGGRVLRGNGRLHPALGHHRIGIAHPELGGDDALGAVLHGADGCGAC